MLARVKLAKIRIHLPSGDYFEANPGDVSTNPPIGTFIRNGAGQEIPLVPVVIVLHEKGSAIQRTFYGAALELIQEEQVVEEVTSPLVLPSH
jgi:hypothetical protein